MGIPVQSLSKTVHPEVAGPKLQQNRQTAYSCLVAAEGLCTNADLHRPVLPHFDVRGLQVTVNDARFMSGFERLGDLLRYREGFVQRGRPFADPVSQGRPLSIREKMPFHGST